MKKRVYTPEQRRAAVARAAQWKCDNPERVKENSRKYVRRNPEKRRATVQKYYENNAEKYASDVKTRRARLGEGPSDEVIEVLLRGRVCYYCGVGVHNEPRRRGQKIPPCKATVDHLIPLCRMLPGYDPNAAKNLVIACYACNLEKGTKTAEEYFVFLAACSREPVLPARSWVRSS